MFLALEALPFTIADAIGSVTKLFTAAVGWVGDVGSAIIASPILLLFVLLPLVGVGVGFFKRIIRFNR